MKTKTIIYLAILCSVVIFCGCTSSYTPIEYSKWVENPVNGLKQIDTINGVNFELQYKPQDYIIACENGKPELSESFYKERKEKLGEMMYFSLDLKSGTQDLLMHNLSDEQEYYKRVNYYSLDFQQDISMVIGADTLPCLMYQFENTYGVAPYIRMSIAFTGKQREKIESDDFEVLVNDRVFGGGELKFLFKKDQFNDIPQIQLN